jgi:hypothetical protein
LITEMLIEKRLGQRRPELIDELIGVFGKGFFPEEVEILVAAFDEHPAGKSLDKATHRGSTKWVAQAAAERAGNSREAHHHVRSEKGSVIVAS